MKLVFKKIIIFYLQPTPAFVISNRDKGLINVMQKTVPNVPHFFCLKHLMKNFDTKYQSKKLKNLVWILTHSRIKVAYVKAVADIASLVKSEMAWFQDVDNGKWYKKSLLTMFKIQHLDIK